MIQALDVPIRVYLEPDGDAVRLPVGDWLEVSIPDPQDGVIEIAHLPEAISIVRPNDHYPLVTRRDGSRINW